MMKTSWSTHFVDLDAPIWSDQPPIELYRLAYRYCEELTKRESWKLLSFVQVSSRGTTPCNVCSLRICRRADDIADGDWADGFPGSTTELGQAAEYRLQLESLRSGPRSLEDEVYLNKISQLFFFKNSQPVTTTFTAQIQSSWL